MTLVIIVLVVAILLVLPINESGVDATTGRVLRLLVIAGALVFVLVRLGGVG